MKQALVTISCCLICMLSNADSITKEKALEIARIYGGDSHLTKSVSVGASIAYEVYPPDAPSAYYMPSCYVINYDSGGYAVIAADDVARPILAYCKSGRFDAKNIPPAQKEWLESTANAIYHSSMSTFNVSELTKAEWAAVNGGNAPQRGNDVILETASWAQRAPFNNRIPYIGGLPCPTGCVATAGAILMRYYKHPEAGSGVIPGYNLNDVTFPNLTLGYKYDWNSMPLKYEEGKYTEYEADQVAQLMYDIGTSVKMKYSPSSSSAYPDDLKNSLIKYFDYDSTIVSLYRFLLKQTNADKVWESTIRKEIDEHRLVLMDGLKWNDNSKSYSGHAFIICGYSGDYFCFNWGWGENEWFGLLTAVDGYDDQMLEYPTHQRIYYNIRPDEGGVACTPIVYATYIAYTTWHYQKNIPFKLNIHCTDLTYTGNYEKTYALIDKNGKIKEIILVDSRTSECVVTSDFCETDKIALCYRLKGDTEWVVADTAPGAMLELTPRAPMKDAVSLYFKGRCVYFVLPNNVAMKFTRQSDGTVIGDPVYKFSIGNTYYGYDGNPYITKKKDCQDWTKFLLASPGETWDVTFYDIRDSYTITLKF